MGKSPRLTLSASATLGKDGPFSNYIQGYQPRQAQQEMADAIAETMANNRMLVAEAGTGTGKTFAYLVPALLSQKRVIISTGTRNLQDQIFNKDLPIVRKALGVPITMALLKGRSNYLCLHRMQLAASEGRFPTRSDASALEEILRWSSSTHSGDIGECTQVQENASIWQMVTSSADNCLGSQCNSFNDCYLMKARRRAQDAELVVINHHLFFADISLREEGVGELLPSADCFIIDEAHQLPEVASNFFGTQVTGNQLLELARDTIAEDINEAGEDKRLRSMAEKLEKAVRDMRLAMGTDLRRDPWDKLSSDKVVQKSLNQLTELLDGLLQILQPQAARGKGLEGCCTRAEELIDRLQFIVSEQDGQNDEIQWFETHKQSFSLNRTPLEIGSRFNQLIQHFPDSSWIFTSATLSVANQFNHFTQQLGICERAETHHWQSPFDFKKQALLFIPKEMPDTQSPNYTQMAVNIAVQVINHAHGGAFILFTSHRALREAAELLTERDLPYPLLVQGEEPRTQLIERFRKLGNAVLLGTGSFWEGVDVRGNALSCVIIDKLPFASPGDPILQARINAMKKRGENAFMQYQLPAAVITLKQGVGRLIRDVSDYGTLVLCDPRLGTKGYGRIFIDSLPDMIKSQNLEVVERFYKHHHQKTS